MTHSSLLAKLQDVFGVYPRPETLLDMSDQTRGLYAAEVAALEAMDWENGAPSDLLGFYEPNTFLSFEGYRYLIPKVFEFCTRFQGSNLNLDLIHVMFEYPFISIDEDLFLSGFKDEEKPLYWDFLEQGHKLVGEDIFEDFEGALSLKTKLTGIS